MTNKPNTYKIIPHLRFIFFKIITKLVNTYKFTCLFPLTCPIKLLVNQKLSFILRIREEMNNKFCRRDYLVNLSNLHLVSPIFYYLSFLSANILPLTQEFHVILWFNEYKYLALHTSSFMFIIYYNKDIFSLLFYFTVFKKINCAFNKCHWLKSKWNLKQHQ